MASPDVGGNLASREDPYYRNSRSNSVRRARNDARATPISREEDSNASRADSSASRGRQFRVGNIGNNGLIYLRPVNRTNVHPGSSSQAQAQSSYTQPSSDGQKTTNSQESNNWRQSFATGTGTYHTSTTPRQSGSDNFAKQSHARNTRNRDDERGYGSKSSASIQQTRVHQTPSRNNGTFRVVIDHASSPSPAHSKGARTKSILEIPIPHYRLGTPHFTGKGSAVLQSSINTGTSPTDAPVSSTSQGAGNSQQASPAPNRPHSRPRSMSQQSERSTYMSSKPLGHRRVVSTEHFQASGDPRDLLIKKRHLPASNEPSHQIRRSPSSGHILSATIPQLIHQITSPNLLDYELLSDFFLTYRSFTRPSELVTALIDRLRLAINSTDDFGRITRVRTFVALRHWILNYFADDFISDLPLRSQFCDLVNSLCADLNADGARREGDLRIVAELKKCWNHTCALYWDMQHAHNHNLSRDDIHPGGVVGSRDPNLHRLSHVPAAHEFSQSTPDFPQGLSSRPGSDISGSGQFFASDYALNKTELLDSSSNSSCAAGRQNVIRESDQSAHAVSCSIPHAVFAGGKFRLKGSPEFQAPPPVMPHRELNADSGPNQGNRKRHHNRSGSFSDALRDDRAPLPTPKASGEEEPQPLAYTVPGAMIRGLLFPPFIPFVESVAPGSPVDENYHFNFDTVDGDENVDEKTRPAANPGVKRFIGSVRRALSARNPEPDLMDERSPVQTEGNAAIRRPSPATSRSGLGVPKRKLVGGRTRQRLDILAAEVSDLFEDAVQEATAAAAAQPPSINVSGSETPQRPANNGTSQSVPLLLSSQRLPPGSRLASNLNSNVTMGSRSIVIVDDTAGQDGTILDGQPADEMDSTLAEDISAMNGLQQPTQIGRSRFQSQDVPIFLEPVPPGSDARSRESRSSVAVTSSDGDVPKNLTTARPPKQNDSLRPLGSNPMVSSPSPASGNLRKFASVRSGKAKALAEDNPATAATPSEDSRPSTQNPFNLGRQPGNQLRRRPGGDLRAADNVNDLNEQSHSNSFPSALGSSKSMVLPPRSSSAHTGHVTGDSAAKHSGKAKSKSSDDVRSTKQPAKPSFEQEVARIAELSDTESEVGIDAALRKLEGKSRLGKPSGLSKVSCGSQSPSTADNAQISDQDGLDVVSRHRLPSEEYALSENDYEGRGTSSGAATKTPSPSGYFRYTTGGGSGAMPAQSKEMSVAGSEDSYSSVPLFERGTSHPPRRRRRSTELTQGRYAQYGVGAKASPEAEEASKLESGAPVRAAPDTDLPRAGSQKSQPESLSHQSFLLDDNQSLSSLSSTTPDDISDARHSQGMRSFFDVEDDDRAGTMAGRRDTLRPAGGSGNMEPAPDSDVTPRSRHLSQFGSHHQMLESLAHPNPADLASSSRQRYSCDVKPARKSKSADDLYDMQHTSTVGPDQPAAAHLPYILAYDSMLLAQQFTIVERDALAEIEWRDLIDMHWNQAPRKFSNWVEYLKVNGRDASGRLLRGGIDTCIARFNLVVNWARSEIVLTQDLNERAAALTKFIHVAQHARRLRNWATMYQITMALVGADCSRLKQTWALVGEKERETLNDLEELILPTRNFHNLRVEMERTTSDGANGGDGGCIPFIGIYTHDLIYNSQKPLFARPQGSGGSAVADAQLINFDRHHTAATIVKNLLRHVEASSKYPFQPSPEVASRCLWIGSLSEDEIHKRSRELEPSSSNTGVGPIGGGGGGVNSNKGQQHNSA
ncbi:MAG: Guanine nucleotide exchange factor lte1 [Alyxoria varia]|nr:MAG: Guanine nucleotide exchange factor lte1 [Alyxoria varia]